MIDGRSVGSRPDGDPPVGRCVWCWEPTWDLGWAPFLGREMPLHVTCAMQMIIVRRKLTVRQPLGNTVAARRYWRLRRHMRKLEEVRRRPRLLGPGQA